MAIDKVGTRANATPGGVPACKPGTGGRSLDGKPDGPGGRGAGRMWGRARPPPDFVGSFGGTHGQSRNELYRRLNLAFTPLHAFLNENERRILPCATS